MKDEELRKLLEEMEVHYRNVRYEFFEMGEIMNKIRKKGVE